MEFRVGRQPEEALSTATLAVRLRERRAELVLSREAAASQMDTSADTLRKWECGRIPQVAAYPAIVRFLGVEPWPEPTTLADKLRAERRRRGITITQAAAVLGVDPNTFWWWEQDRAPHLVAHRERIAAFLRAPRHELEPPVPAPEAEPEDPELTLGQMLRDRRKELGLSQPQAAAQIGINEWTLLSWEHDRRVPTDRFYPALITFLGREPWPAPAKTGHKLRAERLRRGWTQDQLAAVLQVDQGSISKWEAGDGPHLRAAREKVEAFLAGQVRPSRWGRGRRRRKRSRA